jgi:cytochrome c biogenesis protein CcdA
MTLGLDNLALSIVAGGLTTLSPCVFPILPLVVGGALQANKLAPVAMGAGLISVFALMGVLVGAFGSALGIDSNLIHTAGATLLVAFGVVMLVPQLSAAFTRLMTPISSLAGDASQRIQGTSIVSAFGLGGLLGMVWSPCSGPLLASALALVATQGSALRGAVVLGAFGLGAAIPLVAIAYASRSGFAKARNTLQRHIDVFKKGFAILIILLGFAVLTGVNKRIEAFLTDQLPDSWLTLTSKY